VGDDETRRLQALLSQKQNEVDSLIDTLDQQANDSNQQMIGLQKRYD